MIKKIYYWSPFFSNIATSTAVINSAISLKKYSKNLFEPVIIDVFGEWNDNLNLIKENNIKIEKLNLDFFFRKKKINGFLKSRYYQIKIFFLAFFPLLKLINKKKPDVIILHLVTSLPLFLNFFFNLHTKVILRISGLPKLNFLRKLFWKFFLKKISIITVPTVATKQYLENEFKNKKFFLLRDPILNIKNILKNKNNIRNVNKKNFVAIGRLTEQKNFYFLVKCFKVLIDKDPNICLYIIGEGEDHKKIKDFLITNNLEENIYLEGYQKDVFSYLMNSHAFILSSLWEDPGFVLIEAAYSNTLLISSDCKNGPREILNYGKNGFLYKSNNIDDFIKTFKIFQTSSINSIYQKKINAKKMSKNFTIYSHYLNLIKIL